MLMVYDEMGKTAKQFDLSVEETKSYLKEACAILYKARSSRPRPHLDDKIITAWNGKLLRTALFLLYTVFFIIVTLIMNSLLGLMISGLARGGAVLGNKQYIEYATDAAKFIERYLFDKDKGVLLRSCYRANEDAITQT